MRRSKARVPPELPQTPIEAPKQNAGKVEIDFEKLWENAGIYFLHEVLSALCSPCISERSKTRATHWVKIKPPGTAGISPCFHLPGLRFRYLFLTHTH